MFRSRKLINLKKMLFLKTEKMLQNLERHFKAPQSFRNVSLFYFIFSNNHQYNYTKTITRLRRRNIGE